MTNLARQFCRPGILFALLLTWLQPLQAGTFALSTPKTSVIGQNSTATVKAEDTLADVARRYNMGNGEMRLANPDVDPWLPGGGTSVVIPNAYILPDTPRKGLVLNLAEKRMYYYPPRESAHFVPEVITHPVSIGRRDWKTPLGTTRITHRLTEPTWYPPQSVRAEHAANGDPLPFKVPPGPDNPLGEYALVLDVEGYLIHGTNKPLSIGMQVSHGCIRMYPEDIGSLFNRVSAGTPVHIIDQPYKAGVRGRTLYIEVHPNSDKHDPDNIDPLMEVIVDVLRDASDIALEDVDWEKVHVVFERADGVMTPVTHPTGQRTGNELPGMRE